MDDEPEFRRMTTRVLKQARHDVTACCGMEETEAYLATGAKPDLLIVDVVLRASTGKRVASLVKEKSPKTRVMFISGYGNVAVGHPVLLKPFKNHELIALIDEVMSAPNEVFALSRKKH